MKTVAQNAASLFLVLLFPAHANAQAWSDSLTATLNGIAARHQVAGMSVAVVKNDRMLLSYGYGKAVIDSNWAVTDSTAYRIASISKSITALALMQMYEQGFFRLDNDVSPYLGFSLRNPYFPTDTITFRKLLSHTSSLRDGTAYDTFLSATYNNSTIPAIQSLLIPGGDYYSAALWSSTKRPTANYFVYSNINFGVVGTLIERLSGERFDVYCREHIFSVLGLPASFNIQDMPNMRNVAALYRKSGGVWQAQTDDYRGVRPGARNLSAYVVGTNGLLFAPQGGLRISARDLSTFMRAIMNGGIVNGVRLLNDTTTTRMRAIVWSTNGSNGDSYYGIFNKYSIGISPTTELLPGQSLIGHPGEAYGLISDMYGATDGSFAIIFLTNGSGASWQLGQYSGWYRIEEEVYQACYSIGVLLGTTYVGSNDEVPRELELEQNFPNPFNASTKIGFRVWASGNSHVRLSVYDLLGHEVVVLVNEMKGPGSHSVTFNASGLSSGMYFYRLESGGSVQTRKLILLR